MSTRYSGACGLLIILSTLIITSIVFTFFLPGNTILAFGVFIILTLVLLPIVFGGRHRSYRIVGMGAYSYTFREVESPQPGYRPVDTSSVTRVVVDPYDDCEYIISGKPDETYRTACRNDWPFKTISKNSGWIILDEKGNDITNNALSNYQGIATIQSIIPLEKYDSAKDIPDTKDAKEEYSDIDRGVKFYD